MKTYVTQILQKNQPGIFEESDMDAISKVKSPRENKMKKKINLTISLLSSSFFNLNFN